MPERPQPERSQTEQGLTVRRSRGAVAAQRAFGVVGDRGAMPLQLAHMTGRGMRSHADETNRHTMVERGLTVAQRSARTQLQSSTSQQTARHSVPRPESTA